MKINKIEPFHVYDEGTIDKSQYPIIDFKDKSKRYSYLVIDKEFNTYYATSSVGGIKHYLQQLFGTHTTLKTSDKLYYNVAGRFESLLPDSIVVSDNYGVIAKVQLHLNLTYNQLQHILIKEGLK